MNNNDILILTDNLHPCELEQNNLRFIVKNFKTFKSSAHYTETSSVDYYKI